MFAEGSKRQSKAELAAILSHYLMLGGATLPPAI